MCICVGCNEGERLLSHVCPERPGNRRFAPAADASVRSQEAGSRKHEVHHLGQGTGHQALFVCE